MSLQPSGDLTPQSAAPTDVAPLGRSGPTPPHERTAAQEADMAKWDAIEADPDFKKLLAAKIRFIIPASIFFVVYYFTLPVLVGWCPELMKKEVLGKVNIAYLFALSQFFMAWALAFVYVKAAAKWDKAAAGVLTKFK
ncbi:MAG: DUF485 domain-containing protein [Chthoniobacteraceae bacterium]